MLAKRGVAINQDKGSKIAKMNTKIQDYIRAHAKSEELLLPDSAFVVFESEKARNLIVQSNNFMTIGNERVPFDLAPQPTDIIWENRVKEPRLQKLILGSIALFLLFAADVIVTFAFNDA